MKIVVSDCDHSSMSIEEDVLSKSGLSFTHLQCKTEDDVIRQCKGAASILNQYAPMTRRVLAALAPELKQIVRYGVGVNNVDLEAATELGVQVCNVPDYGMHEVTDHSLALMLALSRKIVPMDRRTRSGEWDYRASIPIRRLADLSVGIVGLGRNGRMFADKIRPLGCRILGYDLFYTPCESDGTDFIYSVSLQTLISTSDIIVINCPLTDNTRNLFSDQTFAAMKPGSMIINASRGGIIDEAALERALASGHISGAALDVTETEPLALSSPLRKHENCLLTPHMAWYSEESSQELKRKVAEEAVRFVLGGKCHYPVNTLAENSSDK